jgi:hypothetical protein
VHATLTGSGPGRRWGTTQLNRSLFLALAAQFQNYCRNLHDEAAVVHVTATNPLQGPMLKVLLTQGRKLDTGNARKSTLGADFGRFGIALIVDIVAQGPVAARQLEQLDELIDFRNAIAHGEETKIELVAKASGISSTKKSYNVYRVAVTSLADTLDHVVADRLSTTLGTGRPW